MLVDGVGYCLLVCYQASFLAPFFFAKWVPGSVLPGCDVLSGRILDEEVAKADAQTKDEVQNHHATGQSDGWKNITKKSLIANMMNVEYQV